MARALGAVVFSFVIGLLMHLIFRKEETAKARGHGDAGAEAGRPLWQTAAFFAVDGRHPGFRQLGRARRRRGFFAAVFSLSNG